MSKLTNEQVEARIEMYEEAAEHLSLSVHDSDIEKQQSFIVIKQIRALQRKFLNKHYQYLDSQLKKISDQ
jgi:hypothetical protein